MKTVHLLLVGMGLCLLSGTGLAAPAATPVSTAPGNREILGEKTCWRYYIMRLPPAITVASFQAAGQKSDGAKVSPYLKSRTTLPPPPDWNKPDFDDTEWPFSPQRSVLNRDLSGMAHNFRACIRGRFTVTDPVSANGLSLNLTYRGGVIVYLNGVEITRKNLPSGVLADDTPADLYPNDAWVDASGKAIGERSPWPAVRDRALDTVKIPSSALRKGVNVLAIELRRSPFHPVASKWGDGGGGPISDGFWVPIAWLGIRVGANGAGVESNAGRPKGFQVWVHDRNNRVTPMDYRDPNEAPHPLRLVGPRNGGAWGQLAAGSDTTITGLKASIGQIKHVNGRDSIAENRATFLYGMPPPNNTRDYSDDLLDRPPTALEARKGDNCVAVPLLLRIDIPSNAVPGEYRTELTISASGHPDTKIPAELYVADWGLPDPRNYRTFMSMYQSPETIAMQYKVLPWSEAHWKLLEKSWQLLGRVANKTVIVHAVEQTQFGNERSTIYWIKKADGTYDWDFSVFDRYLDMAIRNCGKPDHVALQICHVGNAFNSKSKSNWSPNPIDQAVIVTTKDPVTGALGSLSAPLFATDEARKFWKPYLAAISARLDKLGCRKALCLGILMDNAPPTELVKTFDDIWPDGDRSRWMRGCHASCSETKPYPAVRDAKGVVVLHEYCYGGGVANAKLGEMRQFPGAYYFRNSVSESLLPLTVFRTLGDYCLYVHGPNCSTKGIGRICLDYWNLNLPRQGGFTRGDLYSRYPYSDCMQRRPTLCSFSWPGPDGALPNVRLEALIDGLQESEAVIVVSEALDQRRARLDPALVKRCDEVLAARKLQTELAIDEFDNHSSCWAVTHPCYYGWKTIRRRLFDCATEVTRSK